MVGVVGVVVEPPGVVEHRREREPRPLGHVARGEEQLGAARAQQLRLVARGRLQGLVVGLGLEAVGPLPAVAVEVLPEAVRVVLARGQVPLRHLRVHRPRGHAPRAEPEREERQPAEQQRQHQPSRPRLPAPGGQARQQRQQHQRHQVGHELGAHEQRPRQGQAGRRHPARAPLVEAAHEEVRRPDREAAHHGLGEQPARVAREAGVQAGHRDGQEAGQERAREPPREQAGPQHAQGVEAGQQQAEGRQVARPVAG